MVTLESSKLFSQLPAGQLRRLREVTREFSFQDGQPIFTEGDPGDGVYVVKSGRVQISAVVAAGQRRVFSRLPPGEVFGEMTVLDHAPRSACASAEGDTSVYFVPRAEMVAMLQTSPELSMTLVQEISGRLREFNRLYLREVLQAERMALVGRFASSIVHDLKNPLTIIGMAAEQACAEGSTAATRQIAQDRIGKQIERITHLVNDILEFTRGTEHTLVFAETNYAEFITAICRDLRHEIACKAVALEFAAAPPARKLMLHPARLARVFYNLVHNAVDAMPDGGTVTLRFQTAGATLVTEVADTGRGIAPEIWERLFEPFTTFGKPRGTGLGLSISKRIVEEHRGTLTARNQPGGGAVFVITLPLAQAEEAGRL